MSVSVPWCDDCRRLTSGVCAAHEPGTIAMPEAIQRGLDDLSDALEAAQTARSVEEWVADLSFDAFNTLIRVKLDATYPAAYFEARQYGVNWHGEHAGEDIDSGVRWATLLRLALAQLDTTA